MTRLLLDYPWTVDKGLGPDPVPYNVILDFLNLLARTKLEPVPFIDPEECNVFWNIIKDRKGQGRFRNVIMFLNHLKGDVGGIFLAQPISAEPTELRDSWKCALRTELGDLTNWRNPQIIVPKLRRPDWHCGTEVGLNWEPNSGESASGPHLRVLAVLEDYESHPFAISDLDPWDLQRIHPAIPDQDRQYPALLPKPSLLNGCSLQNLRDHLNLARAAGWVTGRNYYFIPPMDFDPLGIDKETWRKGRAFRYETAPNSNRTGPVDYRGIVWSWDEYERHWDVQTIPKYIRISHTGERLADPD